MQETVKRFEGRARLVDENFGASELATRFGIERYPAIFVDEVLVAKPKDFGFAGEGGSQGEGRYTPWNAPESRARFQEDLARYVQLALDGELTAEHGVEADSAASTLASLPDFVATTLDGTSLTAADLRGGVTLVELWATWCPPCLRSLPKLSKLQEEFPETLRVVTIAVDSREEDVRRLAEAGGWSFPVLLGTPELVGTFGNVVAVPTLLLYAPDGTGAGAIHGAPPTLDEDVRRAVEELLAR